MPVSTTATPENVVVHPLVLLSVTDHYNRMARNTNKRVVGVLLGQWKGKSVNIANSYALPFEEDEKDPSVWFIDHNYHEAMYDMFKKVNAKEKLVGWYHTGPRLRGSDLEINALFRRYTPNPVLVVIDVRPKDLGVPTDAYFAVEEIHDDGTATTQTFAHVPSLIEAEESEEIGVEHLLRDVKDISHGTLSSNITTQLESLKGLHARVEDVRHYLDKVVKGELPVNHRIIANLQDVFNLMPDLGVEEVARAFSVKTNDEMLVIYLSSLVRATVALHNLINNKIQLRDAEREESKKSEEKEKDKEKKETEKKEESDAKGKESPKEASNDGKGKK
ncbi:Mov34-domain-containing protein [Gonapodya prolifera JEL478]|uniref:Mov34-domain-containing protein n=1 Tax=Gonapodya prolifera (strain JEL478) TaxID=1344416 RepID=A0A139AZW8_GONPJ|nr:Mov34-domain-containing protein [Gonapodya prolifera JEL478]|eukprot:KXS22288.1 Mov34-domain-containing protein [Gonapodya prolifera JEL478]